MSQNKIYLASDNLAPAHPLIMKALLDANEGYALPYGGDSWTETAQKLIQQVCKKDCKVFILPTGTGSNIFALKLTCPNRYESVLCTDIAHINCQETGALEAIVGSKILSVAHHNGKIIPDELIKKIKKEKEFGKHSTLPTVLSVAQPTELGTVYSLNELKTLSKICKAEGLFFHIDGSRLYNAAVTLNVNIHDIIQAADVDIMSLGGTKNGLLNAESLVIFNKDLAKGSDYVQKQTLQLISKMRYLSTQYIPFFKDNLWHNLAKHANDMAQKLAAVINSVSELSLSCDVETNQVFFTAPASWIPLIQEKVACYVWNREKNEIRFITSWSTTDEDIFNLQTIFSELARL